MSPAARVAAAVSIALALAPAAALAKAPPARWYVALGDSLARGWQPDSSGHTGETTQGYVTDVWRALQPRVQGLRVVNFGCAGETARTMISGGACSYLLGSQLSEADAFLRAHPGRIAAITVNIGDNDVENCLAGGKIDQGCVGRELAAVPSRLRAMLAGLRAAAGAKVPIVGMVDYDQFLAYWLRGGAGRSFARRSVGVVTRLNTLAAEVYRRTGAAVADGGRAFATSDLHDRARVPGYGAAPLAVQRICLWTWACSPPPIGFNDHANAIGYGVLAQAILRALRVPSAPATHP